MANTEIAAHPGVTTPGPAPAPSHHPAAIIALHWASAATLMLAVAAILLRDALQADGPRVWLMDAHRQLGLLVLVLLAPRLAMRFTRGIIDFTEGSPAPVRWLAIAAHMTLYVMLIAIPLLGWACSNAHGVSPRLFGLLQLPDLADEDPDLAETLSDWHTWAGWTMLALVAAHVGAALWHHLVRRDHVLVAMLPLLQRRDAGTPGPGAAR